MNVWEKFKDHAKNRWTTRALGRHEGDGGMNHVEYQPAAIQEKIIESLRVE